MTGPNFRKSFKIGRAYLKRVFWGTIRGRFTSLFTSLLFCVSFHAVKTEVGQWGLVPYRGSFYRRYVVA